MRGNSHVRFLGEKGAVMPLTYPIENIVDDIIDFVKTIPYAPHYHLTPYAQVYFSRYGQNLQYTFFKRKSSKHTTWYIFFSRQEDLYIVHYITNNHKDGKYIHAPIKEED